MRSLIDELECQSWPGGRRGRAGVIAVHPQTGVAVIVSSESSHAANQKLASERVLMLLASLPWSSR